MTHARPTGLRRATEAVRPEEKSFWTSERADFVLAGGIGAAGAVAGLAALSIPTTAIGAVLYAASLAAGTGTASIAVAKIVAALAVRDYISPTRRLEVVDKYFDREAIAGYTIERIFGNAGHDFYSHYIDAKTVYDILTLDKKSRAERIETVSDFLLWEREAQHEMMSRGQLDLRSDGSRTYPKNETIEGFPELRDKLTRPGKENSFELDM